jgi:hypothetical protein
MIRTLARLVLVLLATESIGNSQDLPVSIKAFDEAYSSNFQNASPRIKQCRDQFNLLQYRCREEKYWGGKRSVYLLPYATALPSPFLRSLLSIYGHQAVERVLWLVPAERTTNGESLLDLWGQYADTEQPFDCQGVLCSVVLWDLPNGFTAHEKKYRQRIAAGDAIGLDEDEASQQANARYLILCSGVSSDGVIQEPYFDCITAGALKSDGSRWVVAPIFQHNNYQAWGIIDGGAEFIPEGIFAFHPVNGVRALVSQIIRTELEKGPGSFTFVQAPPNTLIAKRISEPSDVFKSMFGASAYWEKVLLRFDLYDTRQTEGRGPGIERSKNALRVYLSMSLSLSKQKLEGYKDPAELGENSDAYQDYLVNRLQRRLKEVCRSHEDDDTGEVFWTCAPAAVKSR